MIRNLTISKFRNIGLNNSEKIAINYSLKKGQLGGLITIIGQNNSGKSNFLDAFEIFKTGKFNDYDITNLSFESSDLNPQLIFEVKDGDDVYQYGFDYQGKKIIQYPEKQKNLIEKSSELLKQLNTFKVNIVNYFGQTNEYRQLVEIIKSWETLNEEELDKKIITFVISYKNCLNMHGQYTTILNHVATNFPNARLVELIKNKLPSELTILSQNFKDRYGYEFIPNIIRYKENPISTKMLETNYSNISESIFFKSVLKALGMNTESIKNAHDQFQKTRSKGFLDKLSKQINKKLLKLTERFNKLYYMEEVKYNFEIDLESEKIFFKMSRGEDPIVIDRQSTGFKWFFNLYFNFLCTYDLKSGDIIISDEFATALHPDGQKELRKFIKEFGVKNDVLFIIATQSPFLADVDNFDELRVVTMDGNNAKISNSFTTVNHNDPDSLLPIKKAFTVQNHVLYDYDTTIVFVEGITDYNYFTMFKKIFNYDCIAFLPIEGVGKNEEQRKSIIKRLLEIRKNNVILLVDGDKAGQAMIKCCDETALEAMSLNEVDTSFREVEDLFSKEDKDKYDIPAKTSGNSSILKNFSSKDDFDDVTKNNFKKVFEALINR